jgi:hypothetical protein
LGGFFSRFKSIGETSREGGLIGRTALETLSLNLNIPGGRVGRGGRRGEGLDGEARHPNAVLLGRAQLVGPGIRRIVRCTAQIKCKQTVF